MRVIQVGLGGFGRSWAEIARATKGVELVAAVDPSLAARAWAIDALGLEEATVFADLERALDGTATDAVLVITPPDTHHVLAKSALRAGKHVLLEKPLATTIDEGRDLIRTAAAMDRILMVSQNYRYRPGAVVARQAVAQGLLGDLAAVRVRCLRDTRDLWPPDNFRYKMRHPFVLDMSIHHADLLRAITGQEVASLYARGWRVPDSPYQYDPAVAATMTLSGGATVLYEGDWATRAPETSWNGDWELIGERGRLTWTGTATDVMSSTLLLQLRGEKPRPLPLPELELSDRAASLAAFGEAVMTNREPETSARDNIHSLAIVLGCVASIESGAVVVPPSMSRPWKDPYAGIGDAAMTDPGTDSRIDVPVIAAEAFGVLDTGRQIAPFSSRLPAFSLADAYRVTAAVRRLRETRGERPIGRKIGFTNRTTWPDYAPMWGYVYDRTVHDLADLGHTFSLEDLAEPRIEPELVFRLAAAPTPGMDERALLGCIVGVAHGFELVQSIYPGWAFTAPDAVAAFGLHGTLLLGPWRPVSSNEEAWAQSLLSFAVDLLRDGEVVDRGHASNVLGGPLSALRHLVELLARDPVNPPLAAGEIVTTGTLTRVPPVAPGETWMTALTGLALGDIAVRFT